MTLTLPTSDGVAMTVARIDAVNGDLYEVERRAVQRAVKKRVAEFRAGRILARQVLAQVGAPECALPVLGNRCPDWPAGFVGSISHSHGWCAVAAAGQERHAGLGLDIERVAVLNGPLRTRVLRPDEAHDCAARAGDNAALFFACKEAVFKAVFPICGEFLDFHDVRITLSGSSFSAGGHASAETNALIGVGQGHLTMDQDMVCALFTLPSADRLATVRP